MKIIGLTGKSGSGKSTVCDIFKKLNIPCLDADTVARQVVEKGSVCLSELVCEFGQEILLPDGNLNRTYLGNIAFSDKEKLSILNSITHKHINEKVNLWLSKMKDEGHNVVIIDAPTLFESGEDKLCDITLGILSNHEKILDRILKRDNIPEEWVKKRSDAQKDDEFFISNCSHIIYNNDSVEELEKTVNDFLNKFSLIR